MPFHLSFASLYSCSAKLSHTLKQGNKEKSIVLYASVFSKVVKTLTAGGNAYYIVRHFVDISYLWYSYTHVGVFISEEENAMMFVRCF